MFIAIAIGSIVILFMGKDIMRRWFEQKENNIEVSFQEDDLKQAKKLRKLSNSIDEFIETEGDIVTIKDVKAKLKGKKSKSTTTPVEA